MKGIKMDVNSFFLFISLSLSTCSCRAVGSPLVMDPNSICRKTRRLAGKQAELCQNQPEIVSEVAKGARLGIRECQYQFRYRRWNCTSHNKYFGKILQQGEWTSDTDILLWRLGKSCPVYSD